MTQRVKTGNAVRGLDAVRMRFADRNNAVRADPPFKGSANRIRSTWLGGYSVRSSGCRKQGASFLPASKLAEVDPW